MASGLARASALMASGTMVSRVLGFAKAILLGYAIGVTSSVSADAFNTGNFLPNTVYMLLLGGMLNAVLVPQIVRAAQQPDGGSGYINKVLTFVSASLLGLTILAMIAAPLLTFLFALDWGPEQLALATAFAYWCLPQIVFYGLYTVLGEVLNARRVFGPFTWAPVLNNVVSIAGILVFIALFGPDPTGARTPADWTPQAIALLAGSATLGVALQGFVLFISWKRAGIRYRPDFAWRGMGLGDTARLGGWTLATIVVMQIAGWVSTNVANSASGVGASTAAINYAWLMFMLPHSVLAVSIGTAYFTQLAEAGQSGRIDELRRDFSASGRLIALVMLFASAVLFAGAPYFARLLQVGASLEQVDQLALVLRAYVLGLAAYSFLFVLQRTFYALSDTRTPFLFTTVQSAVFALGALACLLLPKTVLAAGLAAMFALSTLLQVVLAAALLRRRIGRIDGRRIVRSLASSAPAAVLAGAAGLACVALVRGAVPDPGALLALVLASALGVAMGGVYAILLWALRSPDLRELSRVVRARLGR